MNSIAIVVVTYNPKVSALKGLLNELNDTYCIYISDNGSTNFNVINKLINEYNNVILINNRQNLGIATAQNIAIKNVLLSDKFKAILFLDQDSYISKKDLHQLNTDLIWLQKKYRKIGALCAVQSNVKCNKKISIINKNISSGTLIPVSTLEKVGGMLDDLFIDMVDYEWCWRAQKMGYSLFLDSECHFIHQIGNDKRIFGKIPVAPFRLYYVYRNTIYLIRTNRIPQQLVWTEMYKLIKQLIFNCVFCPQKKERFKYIILGINDGVKNQLGKLTTKV